MKNNDLLKHFLFLAVLVYFSADAIILLIDHGMPFETTQYFLLSVVLACLVMIVILGKLFLQDLKKNTNKEDRG